MATFSKTQVDKLGDRLRSGSTTEADLRDLHDYRKSFAAAYERSAHRIRQEFDLEPTGRPSKSTSSIVEKLQRESVRLSQIQDIAGCRLVVDDIDSQDAVVGRLARVFSGARVIDRRNQPSHGYRAVHVIVDIDDKSIEILVRTMLQHLWAELSEKLSDFVDPMVEYGGGSEVVRDILDWTTQFVSRAEFEKQADDTTDLEVRARRSARKREFERFIRELNALFPKAKDDRSAGRLIELRRFEDSERQRADEARLELELRLHRRGLKHEVVVLDASGEDALHRTHRRYFAEDLAGLANASEADRR